jgi:hypothetical protein
MSKRFVPRGADPAADTYAAAESPLSGATSYPGKRSGGQAPPAPAPTPMRDAIVRAAWTPLDRADARRAEHKQAEQRARELFAAPLDYDDGCTT